MTVRGQGAQDGCGLGTWQVHPRTDGRWQVLMPGGTRACAPASTQQDAIMVAMSLMRYEGGDLVVHHRAQGTRPHHYHVGETSMLTTKR